MTQSEYALEQALIAQLKGMDYGFISISNDSDMRGNLKRQLEVHNSVVLSQNRLAMRSSAFIKITSAESEDGFLVNKDDFQFETGQSQ